MKMTKRLAAIAATAVTAMTSMVGMSSSANDYCLNESAKLQYSLPYENNITAVNDYSEALINTINGWYNGLLGSGAIGNPISYSQNWYASLSDVELLSRLIYAEATTQSNYLTEQDAVTWILVNRVNSSKFPNTLRSVATQSGQFSTITGSSNSTYNSRNPDTSSMPWKMAVWKSCAILSTSDTSDYMWLFGKPTGIDNQLFFYASSLASFGTSSNVLTINGVKVANAAYAGIGYVTNSSDAALYKSSARNIYYNYYN